MDEEDADTSMNPDDDDSEEGRMSQDWSIC